MNILSFKAVVALRKQLIVSTVRLLTRSKLGYKNAGLWSLLIMEYPPSFPSANPSGNHSEKASLANLYVHVARHPTDDPQSIVR